VRAQHVVDQIGRERDLTAGLVGACATSAEQGATEVAAAESGDKKICKSMPVMGSNFPKRV
jgi:hypothetical protein